MAQTTVTEFFHSRKRAFDNDNIKKINVINSRKVKNEPELVNSVAEIPNKEANSTILHQGLSPQEFKESLVNNASNLGTPNSSQSVLTTKTPKISRARKRQINQGVQRVPKRRKLCLTEPVKEEKTIKHFFDKIVAKDKPPSSGSADSSQTNQDTLEKTDVLKEESVSTMTKGIKIAPKAISALTATPTKLSITGANAESKLNKVSFEDIKAQLKSCGKLQELKQCLFKINESSSKLKDIQTQKEKFLKPLSPIKAISVKSPAKVSISSLSQLASPSKSAPAHERFQNLISKETSPSKAVPAFERHHNLASIESSNSLTLPYKYKTLAEFFRCLDTIVCMMHNRREICTFEKVKTSVEQMFKRMFDRTKLGQIKMVFPLAYFFGLENVSKIVSKNSSSRKSLVITPNLNFAEEFLTNQHEVKKFLDPSVMTRRRTIFHKKLLDITKKHHEAFLGTLNPPLSVEDHQIIRWHPKFPLDNVPDIEPSDLPEDTREKVQTAQDVLEKMKSLGLNFPRVEKALSLVTEENQSGDKTEISSGSPKVKTAVKKGLGGVSQSLIDKIRAKESAKNMADMLRNPESEKRLSMLNRLPDFASILRSYFIQEKRAAIQMEVAIAKLYDSYRTSISQNDVEDHIKLLSEVVPDWLSIIPIRKGRFLKIDKKKDLGIVTETIAKAVQKEKGI